MTTVETLTARWILPVSRPPVRDGHVRILAGRIMEIGPGRPADARDLGDCALLPGLVNAHCHLEFSELREPIGHQGNPLHDWIRAVVQHRLRRVDWQPAEATERGLAESRHGGASLVCDIANAHWAQTIDRRFAPPLDVVAMTEVLGLDRARSADTLQAAATAMQAAPPPRLRWGISPHAPYSTLPDTISACVQLARRHAAPLAMHVAESPDEDELTLAAAGPFRDIFEQLGIWPDDAFPTGLDQTRLIEQLCEAPHALIIHGNYLTQSSIERLRRADHATVVYCPRTHHFFGHPPHPIDVLLDQSIRVAIGTDSRASNPDLSMWRELQFLWQQRPDIAPERLLASASLAGAEAVGRTDLGKIESGARAELLQLPVAATTLDGLYAELAQTDQLPQWIPLSAATADSPP